MILYKQTQYGKFLIIIITIISIATFASLLLTATKENFSVGFLILIPLLLITVLLLFYKLTIIITREKIEAKLGIGLIKKTMFIKNINYNTIEEIKMPAIYGIGIRLTPHGWLYNVKFGNAIKIKSDKKTFLVGTEDFKTIQDILKKIKTTC